MYSNERNAQIIVALLKEHNVRHVVASPGNTNFGIVGSLQGDEFFEVYSAVDERSAAYIACGIAETLGEPVAISCTGATASRNYLPALTEAYYRKLPVIAITSFNGNYSLGQMLPQNLDRTVIQRDVALRSVQVPKVKDAEDEAYCNRVVNEALLEIRRHGGGPVHINVCCDYARAGFDVKELPKERIVRRFYQGDKMPAIDPETKVAVFVGSHRPFPPEASHALSRFAETHDAVVLCDHTSNYHGHGATLSALAAENTGRFSGSRAFLTPDLIIDLGEVSGDYVTVGFLKSTSAKVWRVSEDGEVRDRFGRLSAVFEMSEQAFFEHYVGNEAVQQSLREAWDKRDGEIRAGFPELPFTNRWVASRLAPSIPAGSILHMAILNSLRSWNYQPIDPSVDCFCNTGGFGIDGCLSSAVGSSIAAPDRLVFEVTGDLSFFYDMNVLGNRHVGGNLRILLINNNTGAEFHMPYSPAHVMGASVDRYVAASGHNLPRGDAPGTPSLAAGWCSALGFTYLSAASKEELLESIPAFVSGESGVPVVLECFVDVNDEERAASEIAAIDQENASRQKIVKVAKRVVPKGIVSAIKGRGL